MMAQTNNKGIEKEKEDLLRSLDLVLMEKGVQSFTMDVTPVDLKTFLYDKDYLGLKIILSPKQFEAMSALDDDEAETNKYVEGVFELGKGSGKDLMAYLFLARRIYKLLCFGNPLRKFNLPETDTIDLLNVAISGEQAKNVFFIRFSNLIRNAGPKAYRQFGFDPNKDITAGGINFPKNIRAHSGHSQEQSQEGLNLYAAVMDECSGFLPERAQKLYDVLSSSIHTRFPRVGKLLLISYPRYRDDFIEKKYKEGLKEPTTYTAFGPSWEWNPTITRESLDLDFRKNPEKARAYYECKPGEALDAWIRDTLKIDEMIDKAMDNPLDEMGRYKTWFFGKDGYSYFIHVDLALGKTDPEGFKESDIAALAMGHKEESGVKVDFIKTYQAPPGGEVQFSDIRSEILGLRERKFNIAMVTYDGWQSIESRQQLSKMGFNVDLLSVDRNMEPYDTLKESILMGKVRTYNYPLLLEELKRLIVVNGKKVDHLDTGSKDVSDAVCGVVYHCTKEESAGFSFAAIR